MRLQYNSRYDRMRGHLIAFTNYTDKDINKMSRRILEIEYEKTVRQHDNLERAK